MDEVDKNAEFRSDILPHLISSVICGLYYIEESLFGVFCWPKYSTGRSFDRELSVLKPICRAKLLADWPFEGHCIARQSSFDTRIGGSTDIILGFLYLEFQSFSARGSSHQSLQSAKSGVVEKTRMFEIAESP